MDVAISSKKFKPAAMKRINYCRMYLNVSLLSNITNPLGTCVDDAIYRGHFDEMMSRNMGHRVNQHKPNEKAWKVWRRFLHQLCQRDTRHTLKTPLGAWTTAPSDHTRQWDFYYSATNDTLYCNTSLGITKHSRILYDFDKDEDEIVEQLPSDSVPVQVRGTPHTWVIPRPIATRDAIESQDNPSTIMELLDMIQPWERHLLAGTRFIQPESDVWSALCSQPCTMVLDGSAPYGKGAFAWVISINQGNRLVRCSGPAFGKAISSC